ncbi:hypothetical protein AGMMS4956_04780 [Bacteroidia bacterium]|nr:hypothetical protein AGMMS4956_04780 [Bacteroidia bacterium]
MNGLAKHTEKVFEYVSKMDCIKNYTLIGGTALALQLQHRLSEDLDFCRWKTHIDKKNAVDWPAITQELSALGEVSREVLDADQCDFIVQGVKVSFYDNNRLKEPDVLHKQPFLNNLRIADVASIGVMKMEVMSRRTAYRDYYDMYAILNNGVSLDSVISGAERYSQHALRTKNILSILTDMDNVPIDKTFDKLFPTYHITNAEMQLFFADKIREYIVANNLQNKTSLTSVVERTTKK